MDTRPGFDAYYAPNPMRGDFGIPSLSSGSTRTVAIPTTPRCSIPSTAKAFALNLTIVPIGAVDVTLWPTGQPQPSTLSVSSPDGRIVANNAIIPAGPNGSVSVYANATTELIIDVNGYFTDFDSNALAFYPVNPCRLVDTRGNPGGIYGSNLPYGGPALAASGVRTFNLAQSQRCGTLPANAQAFALNLTVVPTSGSLAFLTAFPAGAAVPSSSTLNSLDGRIVANGGIFSGMSGAVSFYSTNATELIVDIVGYFAPDGSPGALLLNTVNPCRGVSDTAARIYPAQNSYPMTYGCPYFPIFTSIAYAVNTTVNPSGSLAYVKAWPYSVMDPVF